MKFIFSKILILLILLILNFKKPKDAISINYSNLLSRFLIKGLYEESHGIIQNDMYDPTLKKTFSSHHRETHTVEWFGQNRNIEPIWATNQKAGDNRRSAAEWVGSDLVFANQSIIHVPFNHSTPYKEYIDEFVGLFVDPSGPINFGALYFDEPGWSIEL